VNCLVPQSEDCLFLTVTSPRVASADPKGYPVFVWMYGGSYTGGYESFWGGTWPPPR
jgi:carboxylesterase type B